MTCAMTRSSISLLLLAVTATANGCTGRKTPNEEAGPTGLCSAQSDCATDQICLHGQCVAAPIPAGGPVRGNPHLTASPGALSFGSVTGPAGRTLAIVLENDGDAMLELGGVTIVPASSSFKLEQLGAGPFWIQPGRSREIFVTYAPASPGAQTATLRIESQAQAVDVPLSGN